MAVIGFEPMQIPVRPREVRYGSPGDRYVVTESRDEVFRTTRIEVRWADGCALSRKVSDMATADLRCAEYVIDQMVKQHARSCQQERIRLGFSSEPDSSPHPYLTLCGELHSDQAACPLCDIEKAKVYVSQQTGRTGHRLVLPEWLAELNNRPLVDSEVGRPPAEEDYVLPLAVVTRRLW